MNMIYAKEVGYFTYIIRRILWRIAPPASIRLHTGVDFPTPKAKFFASDAFVSEGNVDWNSEYILALFLKNSPVRGDFLDVGAHIGYYSCLLSPFVTRIFAFEPDVRNHPYLQRSLASISHAEIVPKAVADRGGEIVFCNDGESSISHIDPSARDGQTVSVTTIDEIVSQRSLTPSAIKIDIEGFEILALQGAAGTCRKFQTVFLVEFNQEDDRPNTWQGLQKFADETDCAIFAVSKHDAGFGKDEFRFAEHRTQELEKLVTKMIFLVPGAHQEWFRKFSSGHLSWTNKGLKPDAIRSLLAEPA